MSLPQRPSHPVRLQDIAHAVGISRSEVSRVLNNRAREGRGVSDLKRREILRLAQEWGYEPNRTAQSLVRGRTDFVGMPIRTGAEHELAPHTHEIIGGMTFSLARHGLHLVLVEVDDDPIASVERMAKARTVDGFLLTDITSEDPRPRFLKEMGVPVVVRGTSPEAGIAAVGTDNRQISHLVLRHLVNHGHRRILFHNIGRELMAGELRWRGFVEEAQALGIADECTYFDGVWTEEDVRRYAIEVLASDDRPTAVHAGDEVAAIAFLSAARMLGLSIPRDLSLTTCLNARFMRRALPEIDAIWIHQDQAAMRAGELMAQVLLKPEGIWNQEWIPPSLETVGSVAPPDSRRVRADYVQVGFPR